ncbi:MAG: hypothetical protein EA393_04610 [Bacteroidetes bacterium]|nr:MAG: hypothetical protein EA393_04610 [Bacteroidota bacterium]
MANTLSIKRTYWVVLMVFTLILLKTDPANGSENFSNGQQIMVYPQNPMYWQYKGEPVLLLGGSVQDNLFQIEDLEEHLDLLVSVGGNYVRSTMSSRDPGNAKPFEKKNGLFDLNEPGVEYWTRFQTFLDLTLERDIIVQVEIWATYDFYWGERGWMQNPFNPKLNSTYTASESSLPEVIDYPAQKQNNPFFRTVPELDNNQVVLTYQHKFVDQLMSITLNYPNVLYCIDNETKARPEWGRYWSAYIRDIAEQAGKKIYVTEMWDNWDPTDGLVPGAVTQGGHLGGWYKENTNPELSKWAKPSNTINDPKSYQFIDISNNNAQRGEVHYNTALFIRNLVKFSDDSRPVNNVKIYGGMLNTLGQDTEYWTGFHKDGEERFWRNIFAGHASVRFHRPNFGLGLNHVAQYHIHSMRMLTDSIDIFNMIPANHLLGKREENEAFCIAVDDKEFAIYFTGKGDIFLNIPPGEYEVNWLQVRSSQWGQPYNLQMPAQLKTPSDDQWVVMIRHL